MARALAANGAEKVFIIGRREERLFETARSACDGKIIAVPGDVTSKASLQEAFNRVKAETARIDLLIANSGVSGPLLPAKGDAAGNQSTLSEFREFFWSIPMEEYTQIFHVNVTGAFYTVLAFLPLLEASNQMPRSPDQPRPQVIVTSSAAGFLRNDMGGYAYSCSKAGLTHLAKMLAFTLCHHDIRVNAIAPGIFETEMVSGYFHQHGIQRATDEGSLPKTMIPLGRCGGETDIAGIILWMAGKAGAYLNSNIVISDGGMLNLMPCSF
ncbi:hypothetical protein PENARI_c056G07245 [Penicillium arizonense]|uniref:Ketoreductase (KR) domain-containing protein n=1 Tax=Penicillium arizonense TaxID=1835702 RepID=A0A1F5L1T1_PENAI|nr:hypothetical protein PENARI_c056G07245 [Penicillium arizonense]OGE47183.1 hypothetical protein PENARI_c056G07245 [Penicillium arizonense]